MTTQMLTAVNNGDSTNLINPYHGNYQADNNLDPVQSVVSMRSRHSHQSNRNGQIAKTIESPYSLSSAVNTAAQDLVQVSMIPSLDNDWNDNTTAITGNTSDQSGSIDDLTRLDKIVSIQNTFQIRCQIWSTMVIASILSMSAFFSPIIMVLLPQIEWFEWKLKECGPECDGLVISSWAVFFRRPRFILPRLCVYRSAVSALIILLMVTYWLFYSVRIAEKRFNEEDAISYHSILLFAISLVDALLFIHYLAVLLLEFRHVETQYFVKVIRSPDGYSHCYSLGPTSIQRASIWILEKYYQDFPRYNPLWDRLLSTRSRNKNSFARNELKYYNVDDEANLTGTPNKNDNLNSTSITLNPLQLSPKSILAQNTAANAGRPKGTYLNGGSSITDGRGNRRHTGNSNNRNNLETASHQSGRSGHHHHHHHHNRRHSERFHDEHEFERRVRKRKSRLINVTEEAFTHVKRVQQTRNGPSIPMDPKEAAQAIFPTIAKTLQKYLRATRQQTRHSMQSILEHLSVCLTYDLSPKTFLEKYFSSSPPFDHLSEPTLLTASNTRPTESIETWNLICDTLVSRSIKSGSMFLLRQGDISLLVTINRFPNINLIEEVVDLENTKFIFKLNSETSV
ncbi:vang-like protein [Sarcoptes scabiei]|uniref:Vang-like protein n=1 Tax=Sarcoptes scabiei TaxID=52283 RepID=A0A132A0Q7_SARSC|nr:vang-like protein [Sarcoptes scabiei]